MELALIMFLCENSFHARFIFIIYLVYRVGVSILQAV